MKKSEKINLKPGSYFNHYYLLMSAPMLMYSGLNYGDVCNNVDIYYTIKNSSISFSSFKIK